jgi:hypothetical protein
MHPRRSLELLRRAGICWVLLCAVIRVGSDPDLPRVVAINIAVVVVFLNTIGG